MEQVSRRLLSQQYLGNNAAAVLEMCQLITQYSGNLWSIDSDDGQTLRLREENPLFPQLTTDWPVMKNQYVIVAPDTGIIARMSPAAYSARYVPIAAIVQAAAAPVLAQCAAAVEAVKYGGFGTATLPGLLVGQTSAPIEVEIRPTQPSVNYAVEAFAITTSAVLATLQVVSVDKVAETPVAPATVGKSKKCRVVVKNNGLITLSGILLLHVTPIVT